MSIVFQNERCRTRSVVEAVLLLSEQEQRCHNRVEVVVYQGDTWHTSVDPRTHVTLRFSNGRDHVTTKHVSREEYKLLKAAYNERFKMYVHRHIETILATGEYQDWIAWKFQCEVNEVEEARRQQLLAVLRTVRRRFTKQAHGGVDFRTEEQWIQDAYDAGIEDVRQLCQMVGKVDLAQERDGDAGFDDSGIM